MMAIVGNPRYFGITKNSRDLLCPPLETLYSD